MSTDKKYVARENSGVLFYDAPGAPTMVGTIQHGKELKVTGEPAIDKNQQDYIKISGTGVNGGLYENDRKTTDNQPDYTGPVSFGREEMRMAAWKKESKTGKNAGQIYMSLAISEKQKKQTNGSVSV